jgi:hypothetical protein
MLEKKTLLVRYLTFENSIKFSNKVNCATIPDFAAAISLSLKQRPYLPIKVDFSAVQLAYSDGMLAVISRISDLRSNGHTFQIVLPNDANIRKLFRQRNWAYYLNPKIFPMSEFTHDRHLVTRQFSGYEDVAVIVKDFMDVVLRNMSFKKKDIISGLEWSINEICDNVINHSESKVGGFAEVTSFVKNETVSFAVADSGRGILNSLKEGIPTLRTDVQAIGEAIKAGVTRNKEYGQGNGLAGSLRITTLTGGSLEITSGTGRFYSTLNNNQHYEAQPLQSYRGTVVSGNIKANSNFSMEKALGFSSKVPYTPIDIIDIDYEMPDEHCLLLIMNKETTGVGTRKAGKQMRIKTLNLLQTKPGYPIVIDWSGVPVISSSFADEFMGKLFVDLGAMSFTSTIKNRNMENLIRNLLDKAIAQRLTQSQDD